METQFETIEKELVFALKFPTAEVLHQASDIRQRGTDLIRGLYLGNIEHTKIKIFFEDNHSKKMVETTIWAVTDETILLKRGARIPIHRIYYAA